MAKKAKVKEEEKESVVFVLWKRYHFRGDPPRPGTPAESRLIEYCSQYIDFTLNPKLNGMIGQSSRRELHNTISVMLTGSSRQQINPAMAECISDFASLLVIGKTLAQAFSELEMHR